MNKLDESRVNRTIVEHIAATIIQKVFRGHQVRALDTDSPPAHSEDGTVKERVFYLSAERRRALENEKRQHRAATDLVKEVDGSMVTTGADFRRMYAAQRRKKAIVIQSAYRQYIAIRCLRRKMHEASVMKKTAAATKIQCLARYVSGSARVRLSRERKMKAKTRRMATLIQTAFRALFARRRVRRRRFMLKWISATMIQGWYRYKKAKIKEVKIKEIVQQQKFFLGAQGMQCLVRRKISRARVNRIRLRRLYLVLYQSATRIGALMRRYLAKRRVYLIDMERRRISQEKEMVAEQENAAAAEADAAADAEQKARDGNSLELARAGLIEQLEALHDANAESVTPQILDENGNSILLLGALYGHIEVVKKCFEWDFDFNQRNAVGLTPLMLAVQGGHTEVATSILQPPMKFKLDRFTPDDSAFLWYSAINNVNPLVARIKRKKPVSDVVLNLLQETSLPVIGTHASFSNGSPILAACRLGKVPLFRHMVKAKADLSLADSDKNTALHFAVQSSLDIVKLVLGLDSSAGILVPDSKRAPMLLAKNMSGKDCRLLAAMAGQEKILNFCEGICIANKEAMLQAKRDQEGADAPTLSWSRDDLNAVLLLVETGNLPCLKYVLDAGFDTRLRVEDEANADIVMLACLHGHLPIIDELMSRKLKFTESDANGRTPVHYAARCKSEAVVAHLLSHEYTSECGLSQDSVTVCDNEGATAMHISAECNVQVKIDLVASHGLETALNTADAQGMTPLLVACKHHHTQIILDFLALEMVDILAVDADGRNALYHLTHSIEDRPLASELRAELGLQGKQSKTERSQNLARMNADIGVFTALVESGCPLYSGKIVSAEQLLTVPIAGVRDPAKLSGKEGESRDRFDPGDLIVQDMSLTLLRGLPQYLSKADCWRLLLATIRYDEGTNKSLMAVLEGGIADKLAAVKPVRKMSISNNPKANDVNQTIAQLADGVTYGGYTVAGWCIKLGNHAALNLLRKNRYNMDLPADIGGDSALHLVAKFGTAPMVDIIVQSDSVHIEGANKKGRTPLMEAAIADNFRVAKRLISCHANARRGLAGKYCAWLLVMARRQEETIQNLQTGRIGDDDAMYFPAPDPSWYDDAMEMSFSV